LCTGGHIQPAQVGAGKVSSVISETLAGLSLQIYPITGFIAQRNAILANGKAATRFVACALPAIFGNAERRAAIMIIRVAVIAGFTNLQKPVSADSTALFHVVTAVRATGQQTTEESEALTTHAIQVVAVAFLAIVFVHEVVPAAALAVCAVQLAIIVTGQYALRIVMAQGFAGRSVDSGVALFAGIHESITAGIHCFGLGVTRKEGKGIGYAQ